MIKKFLVTVLTFIVPLSMAMPALAEKNENGVKMGQLHSVYVSVKNSLNDDGFVGISSSFWGNNNALRAAKDAYNQAVKNANAAYKTARNAAKDKLNSAIRSAGNDLQKRIEAYRVYFNELLAAIRQRSAAKETALQQFINALSGATSNLTPTANSQSVTTSEDTAKTITLTGSDPEGATLTFAVLTNPSHGTLSGAAPNLTYTPNANFNGSDSFTFRVNDGSLNSSAATVSITITGSNDAPAANAQSLTLTKNTSKAITLTGSDPEGSALSFIVVSNPSHGTLSGTVPNLTYLPSNDFTGSDSFTFKVNDGSIDSPAATVSLTINP